MSGNKYFWCERWRLMMAEAACAKRFKKGLKKCAGCEKGKALIQLKIERQKNGIHNDVD